jgi:hypothetical protein
MIRLARRAHRTAALLPVAALATAACGPDAPAPSPGELSASTLRSAEYPNPYLEEGSVRLRGGMYEDAERRVVVFLLPEYAVGDLDGDSVPDAAVILATNPGGSGTFHDLVAVLNRDGQPRAAATTFIGDRVPTERIRIAEGTIELDVTMHGPGDPMCCPSMEATRSFRLDGGALEEVDSPAGAPDDLP